MKIKIQNSTIQNALVGYLPSYPKYATQIMNLANQNAQGTRPKIVGQMSDLIQEFGSGTIEEWAKWYKEKFPTAVDEATEKIYEMVLLLKECIAKIDKDMVRKWVEELVVTKTYVGLKFQEVILKEIAKQVDKEYRLSTPDEESRGIDGYIGDKAVSIKPLTYKIETRLPEQIDIPIIFYDKGKNCITVEYSNTKDNVVPAQRDFDF